MKFPHIDPAIIRNLNEGDHKAFLIVYEACHRGLYTFVHKYLRDDDASQDLVHEIFLKLWQVRTRINPELPLLPYLFRIARNAVYKELKALAERAEAKTEWFSRAQGLEAVQDDHLPGKELQQLVEDAVRALPPQRQRVFRLCRQEGKSYAETANYLGISPYTVKEHMSLALKDIREFLREHSDLAIIWAVFIGLL